MKKIIFFATALLMLASCSKDEPGGTAVESMAGDWYCTIDAVDESGNAIKGGEDYWELGKTHVLTSNVAANTADQMMINTLGVGNFADDYGNPLYPNYAIIAKVSCNQSTMTFSSKEAENLAETELADPMAVTIDGKILKNAAHQKNGSVADSIIMYVVFKDDPWYPDDGYAKYRISGIRYSGLVEND